MSFPIPHHLAGGIHPGAFVQPTAPDTSDVQDGVLWIDTSSGTPPYPLKLWDQSSSTWLPLLASLGSDGCIHFDSGATICAPDLHSIEIIDGAHLSRIFLGFDSVIIKARNDSSLSFTDHTLNLTLNGFPELDVPFPKSTTPAHYVLGRDGTSGLPFWKPASAVQLRNPLPQPPATLFTCLQMRCGVSLNCTNHLVSLYDNWARWLNPLFAVGGSLAFEALLDELAGAIVVEEATEATPAIWTQFRPLLEGAFGVLTGNLLPPLVTDTRADLQKMLFCALSCAGGEVTLSQTEIDAWHAAQGAYGGWAIASLQGELVQLLTQFTPLQDWLTAASTASASSVCDLWTCP